MITPFRKKNLCRLASSVVISVLEDILGQTPRSYGLSFCMKDLTEEEFETVEYLVVQFLAEYSQYVDMIADNQRISVNLKQSLDSIQDRIPVLCRAE
jgi:hypothetical protein